MKKKKALFLTRAAVIGALYIVLTIISNMFGLASGVIQVRISEALTILPVFTPAAVPGLFAGCILSNLLTGSAPWDILFGSLATLLGALGTFLFRKKPLLTPVFPIISNTLIVPFVLAKVYRVEEALSFLFLTVFLGEVISAGIFGILLFKILSKHKREIFKT